MIGKYVKQQHQYRKARVHNTNDFPTTPKNTKKKEKKKQQTP